MFPDFVSSIVNQSERVVRLEMTRENNLMRADMEIGNEKIAFYENDIIASDRTSAQISAEVQMMHEKYDFNLCIVKSKRVKWSHFIECN